jgi:raffinose/stachyose/melibiose transport system permease protein
MIKAKNANCALDIKNRGVRVFNYILLISVVILIIMPMFILFVNSFKGDREYMYSGVFQLPESFFELVNYKAAIINGKLLLGLKNTFFLVVASTAVSVLFGTMVAYAVQRFNFMLKKWILAAFLISISIPSITTQIATFSLINGLGLYNTIFAPILIYIGSDVIQIYIFLQFISKIPVDIDESAMIDGASYFKIYWSILLPQMKAAIATCAILKTIGIYNDMYIQYLYMPSPDLRTVSTAIIMFHNTAKDAQWNIMSAGMIFTMIPTIIIYLFAQKYILAGITDGAIK